MNAEEKAKELVEHFAETVPPIIFDPLMERDWQTAKQCALICVDEMQLALKFTNDSKWYVLALLYWRQVKEAIEKQ